MVRPEHLNAKLEQISKYVALLGPFRPCDIEALKQNPERLAACERFMYRLCQSLASMVEFRNA